MSHSQTSLGNGLPAQNGKHVVPPVDDGDRHRFWLVLLEMAAPALGGHQQLGDLVAADDLPRYRPTLSRPVTLSSVTTPQNVSM